MTRTLIYDEVFKQFYDTAAIRGKPAGLWPVATIVAGDIVRTLQMEYPQHFVEAALAAQQEGFVLGWLPDDEHSVVKVLSETCGACDGSGAVDSGGVTPWGSGIEAACPECGGAAVTE